MPLFEAFALGLAQDPGGAYAAGFGQRQPNGPNVSSAYFDSSMSHTPIDFNFARA
jgi:hypothetical protein